MTAKIQAIVTQTNKINAKWYSDMVTDVIESFSKGQKTVTPLQIAEAVRDAFINEDEDAYISSTEVKRINETVVIQALSYEVRYFDYDLDEEVAVIQIGVDIHNTIFIGDAKIKKG